MLIDTQAYFRQLDLRMVKCYPTYAARVVLKVLSSYIDFQAKKAGLYKKALPDAAGRAYSFMIG